MEHEKKGGEGWVGVEHVEAIIWYAAHGIVSGRELGEILQSYVGDCTALEELGFLKFKKRKIWLEEEGKGKRRGLYGGKLKPKRKERGENGKEGWRIPNWLKDLERDRQWVRRLGWGGEADKRRHKQEINNEWRRKRE